MKQQSSGERVDTQGKHGDTVNRGEKGGKRNKRDLLKLSSQVVEVSDADYRSLHLPCDELAESSHSSSSS